MKKKYIKYALIKFILYITLFNYIISQRKDKFLNSTQNIIDKKQKNHKKKQIILISKTIGACIVFILLYIILNKIIKKIIQKKDTFIYLNSMLIKKGCLDEEIISYVVFYLNIKYFFDFIKQKLMNTCKYKDKDKYTKYETGCSICLGEFKPETKVIITSCEHIFHYTCMIKYLHLIEDDMLKKKNENNFSNVINYFNCPICKFNVLQKKKQKNDIKNNKDENITKVDNNNITKDNNKIIIINNLNNEQSMINSNSIKINDSKSLSEISISSSAIKLDSKSSRISIIHSRKAYLFKKRQNKKFFKNKNRKNDNNKKLIINNATKEILKLTVENNKIVLEDKK